MARGYRRAVTVRDFDDDPRGRWRSACAVFDAMVPWFVAQARARGVAADARFGTLWSRVPAAVSDATVSPRALFYLSIRVDGVYEPYESYLGYKSAPEAFRSFEIPTVDQVRALMSGHHRPGCAGGGFGLR